EDRRIRQQINSRTQLQQRLWRSTPHLKAATLHRPIQPQTRTVRRRPLSRPTPLKQSARMPLLAGIHVSGGASAGAAYEIELRITNFGPGPVAVMNRCMGAPTPEMLWP